MKNESPKGTLGVLQAISEIRRCFLSVASGEGRSKRRIFRIVPDTFPFFRFEEQNTGQKKLDALLLSPRVTFVTRRNGDVYCDRSFDARTYRPPSCETWKFIIPRGMQEMYPLTFIKSFTFIHLLTHRQMLSNT